ncbi:MAG: methylenetetrahydrofolate reductase [NAD(P)H] [Alphaproteobacteria bacterium]|jgi:methylenetetrahydrofolate reductase (NADPH)
MLPTVSFEFFPPKTERMASTLWQSVQRLTPFKPSFVSVTYGAGGTTRERTHETVRKITQETSLSAAAHLTCVSATSLEVDEIANDYWAMGVRHIVALRGDMPEPGQEYQPTVNGYAYASDLVTGLKKLHDFEISVAAYPETHPEARDLATEIDNLKRKFDAGASRAITQFFFETKDFLHYRDKMATAKLEMPIIPGILPVTNFKSMVAFAGRCGATVPKWVSQRFEGLDDDLETRSGIAAAMAVEQCKELEREGVNAFHFYTLNRAELTTAICRMLGLGQNTES